MREVVTHAQITIDVERVMAAAEMVTAVKMAMVAHVATKTESA